MDVDGDAAAVVGDGNGAVEIDLDADVLAMAGEGLVDRVVDELVDEMVQPLGAGVADVHAGPGPDVGGIAEDVDVLAFVDIAVVGGEGRGGDILYGIRDIHRSDLILRQFGIVRTGLVLRDSFFVTFLFLLFHRLAGQLFEPLEIGRIDSAQMRAS